MYQFLKNIPWFLQFFISKINKMLILNNRCDIVDNCVVYLLVYFFLYKVIHTIKSLQLQENVFFSVAFVYSDAGVAICVSSSGGYRLTPISALMTAPRRLVPTLTLHVFLSLNCFKTEFA